MAHTNAHVHTTIHHAHVTHKYACTLRTQHHTHNHVQQNGNCPLYIASWKGHDKTVEILLQAGATVDLQNKVESYYSLLWEMVCIQT